MITITGTLFFVLALCAGVVVTQRAPSVELTPVTRDNFDAVVGLCVAPEQARFVEPPAKGLARVHMIGSQLDTETVAIRDVNTGNVVGLLSSELESRKWNVWIRQFLIDCAYQGQGYESAALEAMKKRIKARYEFFHHRDVTIYVSVHVDDVKMRELYEKHGFHVDGDTDPVAEYVRLKYDPLWFSFW